MAYGRLEVYWPDGQFDTFFLESDTVSVGRADGNAITLDTETISRYHFSIVKQGEEVTITDLDSANGTFVDGVQLPSNEPRALGAVEEIQVGALRIIYFQVDDSPTLAIHASNDATQRIEREEAHIRLDLDVSRLNVWPAASASAELSITNTGKETNRFSIRASGIPGEWLRLNHSELELTAGETSYILINIKPPRRPNTVPNRYQVTLEVCPVNNPDLAVRALMDVNIHAYSGFGMALVPQREPGDAISIFLHNQGSAPLSISLKASDPQKLLKFRLTSAPINLQAGQRMRVDMDITADAPPLVGSPSIHKFTVEAQSRDAAGFVASASGQVAIPPRLPFWLALTIGGIVLSAVILAALGIFSLLKPDQPLIESIQVNSERLAQGEDLIISVQASHISTFDVLVNQIAVRQDEPGTSRSFTVPTSELSGPLEITVIGRNNSLSASAQVSSFVYAPMHIAHFEVNPNVLVRYVVGTLNISWDVPGAAFVRISGLSSFTTQLFQPSTQYSPSQALQGISGIANESLEIMLYAEDEAGNNLQETILVPLIDPQCAVVETFMLRQGPNERFAPVQEILEGTSVIVSAQDAEAGWLRVELPGGSNGWAVREVLACADTFSLSDLRTEVTLPLPTDTPVPSTSIPTALPTAEQTREAGN